MGEEKGVRRIPRRHKGLLPMSGPDLEVVRSIGIMETDIGAGPLRRPEQFSAIVKRIAAEEAERGKAPDDEL